MIEFRPLPADHPDLAPSPMFRAAPLTLGYALEQSSIRGLCGNRQRDHLVCVRAILRSIIDKIL